MSWQKERDLLIAQTMSFVQSITGKKPDDEARPETRIEFTPVDRIESAERPIEIVPAARPIEIVPVARPSQDLRREIRDEIQGRVAAFRAHQQLFHRERDAYFNSVLTKARASTEGKPKAPES
jgi:hypothetical protein